METIEQINLKEIVTDSLSKSQSYSAYRDLVSQLVAENSTTGSEKTDALVNYTILNNKRMKRWDKTMKVSDTATERLSKFKGNVTWLVLTESWCGDAAHIVPAMQKVAEVNSGIDLKLVMRDENEALMNQYLTNGGMAIPKLIMIDNETNDVINSYGPRPHDATKLVNDYKAAHGKLTPEFKEDLQRWYNADKGQSTINDLLDMLNV